MKQIQDLFQALGIQPHLRNDIHPDELVRYTYHNSYCQNEAGLLTALNLCGQNLSFTYEQASTFLDFDWSELVSLNMSENHFASLRLPAMPRLQFLNLSEMDVLGELTFTAAMPALEELDLNECRLTKLTLPAGFQQLKYLDVSRNKHFREMELKGEFPSLQYLDASNNALKRISFSAPLPSLQHMYLGENKVENWDWILPFPQLQTLHINNNLLTKLPAGDVASFEKFFPEILNLNIEKNNLSDTVKIFSEGKRCDLEKLENYLLDYAQGSELDNECKVLLIGNGNVGKSCLVNRIVNDDFNPEWDSTHAIVVMEPYEDERVKPWKLNFWDFGGQDIYHATHRLFMQSNAVYLLLWDAETEGKPFTKRTEAGKERTYRNYKLPYWLAYAKQLGKGSPILIVQTKCINPENERDLPHIRKAYPKVKFLHIDSKKPDWDDNGVEDLLKEIRRAIKRIKPNTEIPSNWVAIRQAIRNIQEKESHIPEAERKQQTLTKEAFLQLATDVKDPMLVLKWLSLTGVVFYDFGHERLFEGKIILDQGWAIQAIYTLFDREDFYYDSFQNKQGRFSGKDLLKVWKDKSPADCELFVSFMLSCELCFEVTEKEEDRWRIPFEERVFIAPQMLPDTKHPSVKKHWKNAPSLYIRYRHDFLHYGIMQSFIIRTQKLAKVDDIWKNGIVLSHTQNNVEHEALIEFIDKTERTEDDEKTRMELYLRVSQGGKFLLDAIRNLIEELQDSPGKESVSIDGKNFVPLRELQSHDPNETRIKCENGKYHDFASFEPFLQKDSNASIESSDTDNPTLPMSKTKQVPARTHIKSLIADNKFKEALNLIKGILPSQENDVVSLLGRVNRLRAQEDRGVINTSDANITQNRLRFAISHLADDVPEQAKVEIVVAPPPVVTISESSSNTDNSTQPPAKPKVYFSYAWGDDDEEGESREEIVNQMYKALKKDGFEVGRDKMSMEYGDRISLFMKELSEGDLIIVFMSDKYLKSRFCMTELCDIYLQSTQEPAKFAQKILPVRVENIKLDDPDVLLDYLDYWEAYFEKWHKAVQRRPNLGKSNLDKFERSRRIKNDAGDVLGHFADLNASTNTLLSENDFERVKSMILKRLGQ